MNRRGFLKRLGAVGAAAALPIGWKASQLDTPLSEPPSLPDVTPPASLPLPEKVRVEDQYGNLIQEADAKILPRHCGSLMVDGESHLVSEITGPNLVPDMIDVTMCGDNVPRYMKGLVDPGEIEFKLYDPDRKTDGRLRERVLDNEIVDFRLKLPGYKTEEWRFSGIVTNWSRPVSPYSIDRRASEVDLSVKLTGEVEKGRWGATRNRRRKASKATSRRQNGKPRATSHRVGPQ